MVLAQPVEDAERISVDVSARNLVFRARNNDGIWHGLDYRRFTENGEISPRAMVSLTDL